MAPSAVETAEARDIKNVLSALLASEGSGGHRFCADLEMNDAVSARALSDAVHHLCTLHGRYPGVVDLAADRLVDQPQVRDWMKGAIAASTIERGYLTRVVVAAGPFPSTPGQAECETTMVGQRHAIEMLAQSDRTGCALGAAIALMLDWGALRLVIDRAASRFGIEASESIVPDAQETLAIAKLASLSKPGVERAIVFGAQQLLVQHRGLWDLLEARQIARETL